MIQYSQDLDTFIANKKECAKLFGISQSGFQKWGYRPLGKFKNEVYYDLCSLIQQRSEDLQNAAVSQLSQERVKYLQARRQKAEIEIKVLEHEYFPASLIEEIWSNQLTYFKAKLQTLPHKLAKLLVSIKTAGKTKETLTKSLREILAELSEYDNEQYQKAARNPLHGITQDTAPDK